MTDSAGVSKTCSLCGVDVTALPRTKDKADRYFCTPCYERAVETQHSAREHHGTYAIHGIDQHHQRTEPPPVMAPPVAKRPCPICGHGMSSDDFICTRCGYNPRTGQSLQTRAPAEKPVPAGFWAAILWPAYLYIRPDTFFRMFGRLDIPGLNRFFALLVGFAVAADRIDYRAAIAQMGGKPFPIPDRWPFYWAVVFVSGLISSLLYVYIGGWWYRMRLRFSGDRTAEPSVVRHVYILSWLPFAAPVLIDKALDSLMYAKPSEAWNAPFGIMDGLMIVCLIWSIWISFRGVRTMFDTRLARAVVWFLVLPLMVYGIATLVVFGAVVATMFLGNPAPTVGMPSNFSSQTWRFDYPGNWFVEDTHPDYHPDNFVIVTPVQDAAFVVDLQEGIVGSPQEMVEYKLELLKLNYGVVTPQAPLTSWGRFNGSGHTLHLQEGRDIYMGRLFVTDLGQQRMFVVQEVWPMADERQLQPGFELIRRTFDLNP